MTVRATKFTPEVLLTVPRRSAGVPNADGSRVLYTISAYSFAEHSKASEIRVLDVATRRSTLITDSDGASEPTWLGDDHVLILTPGDKGSTKVKVGQVENFKKRSVIPNRSLYIPST